MEESEFHDLVSRSDAVEDAESAASATLETLGEAISEGQAADLAEWLPERYADATTGVGGREPESLSAEEFRERVRRREGGDPDPDAVRERIAAVGDALSEAVPHEELLAVRSQLPTELDGAF